MEDRGHSAGSDKRSGCLIRVRLIQAGLNQPSLVQRPVGRVSRQRAVSFGPAPRRAVVGVAALLLLAGGVVPTHAGAPRPAPASGTPAPKAPAAPDAPETPAGEGEPAGEGDASSRRRPRGPRGDAAVRQLVDATLAAAAESGDLAAAIAELEAIIDRVALHATEREFDAIVPADAWRRVLLVLSSVPAAARTPLLAELRLHTAATEELAYLLRVDPEPDADPYRVLQRLIKAQGEEVDGFPALAAAVAAVHDGAKPLSSRVNSVVATGSGAEEVFAYFVRNRRRMVLDPTETPADLLAYVVNSSAKVDELEWALRTNPRGPALADAYSGIVYDQASLSGSSRPKLETSGQAFSLALIKQVGGVCAHQAHYAAHVGKAFGVPTATVSGQNGEIGHAWLGHFAAAGRGRAGWDFSVGRYEEYESARGTTRCPVSGRVLTDGELALLGAAALTPADNRRAAAALADVVQRWAVAAPAADAGPVPGLRAAKKPRTSDAAGRLALLRQAVEFEPSEARPWLVMVGECEAGRLDRAAMKAWGDALIRLCGERYPDFAMGLLERMFASVPDAEQQAAMWDWAFAQFRERRPDLATGARMAQAQVWLKAGDMNKAYAALDEVLETFGNESPDVPAAAKMLLDLLDKGGRRDMKAPRLQRAWSSLRQPEAVSAEFLWASNWYQIGRLYLAQLEADGATREAGEVRLRLASVAK